MRSDRAVDSRSRIVVSARALSPSGIESRTQARRDDGAQIVAPSEDTIANARDEVVDHITQRARKYGHERRHYFPSSSQSPKNMNAGIRAHEQRAVTGLYDYALGQIGAPVNRNSRLECFSLQRGKSERRSRAVMLQDKLHPAMTQSAMPVVEDDLSWLRERRHARNYYIAWIRTPAGFLPTALSKASRHHLFAR